MTRMDPAPHQIALPLIALFIAVIRIVISVVVGCVTESEAYPKSRSETAVMETMEAPAMEGVSAAMEAAPMETSHATPMEASAAKAATAVEASASASAAAARRGDIRAQHSKRGQRQQGYYRLTKHHSLP